MILKVLSTFILLASFQGIIFSFIAFYSKKYRSKSSFFLGLLILVFSLNNLQYYFWEEDYIDEEFFYGYLFVPFASLIMVFYYYYVKSFLFPNLKFRKIQYCLFLPFLLFLFVSGCYKVLYVTHLLSKQFELFFENVVVIHEIFSLCFSIVLLVMSYFQIIKFEKLESQGKSSLPKIRLNWLKILSLINFISCIIWIASIIEESLYGSDDITYYYVLWVGMSITIYAMGHIGLYRFEVLVEQKNIRKHSNISTKHIPNTEQPIENKHIAAMIEFVKIKKNYLKSDLSLDEVALDLNLNKNYLSRIINSELGTSFTNYVNELRVEEAKNYISNPEFKNYTLLAIGLEAGFNSKTSFNTIFKKFTGMTPSQYRLNK